MTALSSRLQQLKDEAARQAGAWAAARAALRALPGNVRFAIPTAFVDELDRAVEAPRADALLVRPHQLRA